MLRPSLGSAQGFHLTLSDRTDKVGRLARDDVNMPDFDSFPIHVQVSEAKFEVAAYDLLRSEPVIAFPPALPPNPSAACWSQAWCPSEYCGPSLVPV